MTLLWLACAVAVSAPLLAWLAGGIRLRRDFFFVVMFGQALVYLFVAPSIAALALSLSQRDRYAYFLWWGLPLFVVPFVGSYIIAVRAWARRAVPAQQFTVRVVPSVLFASGSIVLGLGWLLVALTRNLLYRRLGAEGIAAAQLDLPLIEMVLYRGFMEYAPFLAIVSLAVLRLGRPPVAWLQLLWRATLALICLLYGVHVLVNSRLAGVLFLAALVGVSYITAAAPPRVRWERGVLAGVVLLGAAYAVRVSENVRERISAGGSALDVGNLNPVGRIGGGEEGYQLRLNGIDLVALISDNVRSQGPAMGKAWAVPLLLQLDPLFRTAATEQLKRAALTTAKSFLLLQYAGIAEPDYYSCMISDAYGNLGLAGLTAVAIVLALACAAAATGLQGGRSAGMVIVSAFILSRVLPFEQEFASLLFGWIKLSPLVLGVLFFNPLARVSDARGPAARPAAPALPFATVP